jgi:hypothetical protein
MTHSLFPSFPRKRESKGKRYVARPWTPAFAGVTNTILQMRLPCE